METLAQPKQRSMTLVWLGIAAVALAIVLLAGVLVLERYAFGPRAGSPGRVGWLFWVVAIPVYFLLQFFAEVVLEGLFAARSPALKAVPVALIVLFYATYFAFAT